MKKKIAEGKTLGLKYEIFDNTGVIDHIEFNKDMLCIAPPAGSKIRVPELGNYTFRLNRQQNVQLQGEQDNIELRDMDAIGNDGQELTLFLLTHGNHNQGAYFGSLNHNTRTAVNNARSMREQLYPWASVWALFTLAMVAFFIDMLSVHHHPLLDSIVLTMFCVPVIMLPLFLAGSGIGLLRSMAVKRNRDFKAYARSLSEKLQIKSAGMI